MLTMAVKFVVGMIVMTIGCTIAWQQFVTDTLYNCTDPAWLDYVRPGNWVHQPVEVTAVTSGRSMSEPDTVKTGWSISALWRLWFSFVGVSVLVSALLASMP